MHEKVDKLTAIQTASIQKGLAPLGAVDESQHCKRLLTLFDITLPLNLPSDLQHLCSRLESDVFLRNEVVRALSIFKSILLMEFHYESPFFFAV